MSMNWGAVGFEGGPKRIHNFHVYVQYVRRSHYDMGAGRAPHIGPTSTYEPVASGKTVKEARAGLARWAKRELPRLEKSREYMMFHSGYFVKFFIEEETLTLVDTGEYEKA
jgi:hypothetical protein